MPIYVQEMVLISESLVGLARVTSDHAFNATIWSVCLYMCVRVCFCARDCVRKCVYT